MSAGSVSLVAGLSVGIWGKKKVVLLSESLNFFSFFFAVLRLELRALTLSYSISPFFCDRVF
jgi:hypothetical protein